MIMTKYHLHSDCTQKSSLHTFTEIWTSKASNMSKSRKHFLPTRGVANRYTAAPLQYHTLNFKNTTIKDVHNALMFYTP